MAMEIDSKEVVLEMHSENGNNIQKKRVGSPWICDNCYAYNSNWCKKWQEETTPWSWCYAWDKREDE